MHPLPPRPTRGQSLIEILIALAVLSILGLTVFRLSAISSQLVSYTRARIAARHLALEKIELIRNLAYEDVGTLGGIPPGPITQSDITKLNGLSYSVRTSIIYIDDPFDSLAPSDTNPTDYKRARVEVSWAGIASSSRNPIVLVTDISAKHEIEVEGGVLNVFVFDSNGNPLPLATVRITSSGLDPEIDVTQTTDDDGEVSLPGAPECVACYRIAVSKTGYSSDRTYSLAEITNPIKADQGVFASSITQISFAIDKVSTLTVSSINGEATGYSPAPGVTFQLRGTKILGTDAYAQMIYKVDQSYTTDSSGNLTIPNVEWDVYQIFMPTITSWDIAGSFPLIPINIVPDSNSDLDFVVAPHTANSLLSIVKDPAQALIGGAFVRIYDGAGFDQTQAVGQAQTANVGQTFFPSLEEKTYQVEATASGYLNYSGEVIISGYTKDEVVLTPE